jgi:hypothetical protein
LGLSWLAFEWFIGTSSVVSLTFVTDSAALSGVQPLVTPPHA